MVASVAGFAAGMIDVGGEDAIPPHGLTRGDPMPTTETGTAGARGERWRFGLAALIGALAGATLFPRPARGRTREDVRADPAPGDPGSAPPSG